MNWESQFTFCLFKPQICHLPGHVKYHSCGNEQEVMSKVVRHFRAPSAKHAFKFKTRRVSHLVIKVLLKNQKVAAFGPNQGLN